MTEKPAAGNPPELYANAGASLAALASRTRLPEPSGPPPVPADHAMADFYSGTGRQQPK